MGQRAFRAAGVRGERPGRQALLAVLFVVGAACSASPGPADTGSGGGAGQAGSGGESGGAGGSSGGTTATAGAGGVAGFGGFGGAGGLPSPCEEEAKDFIYLLGTDSSLSRFDPQAETLTPLGKFVCPGEEMGLANSMAVDRLGRAWVNYVGGHLFRVDIKTLECEPLPGYEPCQKNYCQFGMAFVSDAPGSEEETLYIAQYNKGLAKLDTTTLAVTPIDFFSGLGGANVDLTGTADATLFGIFKWSPATVAQIDKSTAQILQMYEPALDVGTSFAMAHWGGLFYLMSKNNIYRYDVVLNQTTLLLDNLEMYLSGAGVSTCAPTKPPE